MCVVKLESRSLNMAQRKVKGGFLKLVKYKPCVNKVVFKKVFMFLLKGNETC